MTFWIVLAGVLLVLWLLGQIRVAATADYSTAGFFLTAKVGPKHIVIIPSKASKKDKAAKKSDEPAVQSKSTDETNKPQRKIKDTVSVALRFLPLVCDAAGLLIRKICIDNVLIHLIWGAADPADAAKGYGAANAVMGVLWPAIEHNFKVKDHDLDVAIDFERDKPEVICNAQISISIGQIVTVVLILGLKALKIYLGMRRDISLKNDNEKAVQA